MPVKSKPKAEIVEGHYFLTLDQIRSFYYPKHISVGEINLQRVGSTIMINNDIITIIPEPVEKYKTPVK